MLNAGAWTHYSLALFDACAQLTAPLVEVHISDPKQRPEEFRHTSVVEPHAAATIAGQGIDGYRQALERLAPPRRLRRLARAATRSRYARGGRGRGGDGGGTAGDRGGRCATTRVPAARTLATITLVGVGVRLAGGRRARRGWPMLLLAELNPDRRPA